MLRNEKQPKGFLNTLQLNVFNDHPTQDIRLNCLFVSSKVHLYEEIDVTSVLFDNTLCDCANLVFPPSLVKVRGAGPHGE